MTDKLQALILCGFMCLVPIGLGNAMANSFDCDAIVGSNSTEQQYFDSHHFTIAEGKVKCKSSIDQVKTFADFIGLPMGVIGFFILTREAKEEPVKMKEAHQKVLPMFKIGLFGLAGTALVMFITLMIDSLDSNGKIGACIIEGGIGIGISIAFVIRGHQYNKFVQSKGTHTSNDV